MIAAAGARDVEQVALAVVDLFEVGIIGDILDALLGGDYLIVAGHDGDGAEFQPLCEMHGPDGELARCDLDPFAKFDRQ